MPIADSLRAALEALQGTVDRSALVLCLHPADYAALSRSVDIVELDNQSHTLGHAPTFQGLQVFTTTAIPQGTACVASREVVHSRTFTPLSNHISFRADANAEFQRVLIHAGVLTPAERRVLNDVESPDPPEPRTLWEHLLDEPEE